MQSSVLGILWPLTSAAHPPAYTERPVWLLDPNTYPSILVVLTEPLQIS